MTSVSWILSDCSVLRKGMLGYIYLILLLIIDNNSYYISSQKIVC